MQENQQSKLALIKMKSGNSPKFNQLFLGPFINIFENVIKIQSRVCFVSYFANKQKQTNPLSHNLLPWWGEQIVTEHELKM